MEILESSNSFHNPRVRHQNEHMNPDETGGGKQSEATADKGD